MQNTAETGKKKRKRSRRAQRALVMSGVCAAVLFYLAGCLVVYHNGRALEAMGKEPVNQRVALQAADFPLLHDSEFFRVFAEKLTYYPHKPEVAARLFDLAVQKAPSSHQAFFSLAYYIASRRCCPEQVEYLLQETVRRCPTHPRMNRIAATYLLMLNDQDRAMIFIRRALELEPGSAPELFRMLEQSGNGIEEMVQVTPDTADALIQLAYYISRQNPQQSGTLQEVLARLNRKDLAPDQRLKVAQLAWSAGAHEMARKQAELAATDEDSKAESLAFQAQMLWQDGTPDAASRMADLAELQYRKDGGLERAARYAMGIAALQHSQNQPQAAKTRMLRILNDYPGYAPAYFQMAQFSRDESAELELFYLKKAQDLAPDNLDYRKVYANRLLETGHLKEAESAFSDLLNSNSLDQDAFLGLARCRMAAGDRPGALEILQQAVQRAITSPQIYYQLGQLYASVGDFEKAALAYIEFARISPNPVDGWNLAGDAYMNMGRYPYARDQYRKVLAKDPNNRHALDALANLQLLGY